MSTHDTTDPTDPDRVAEVMRKPTWTVDDVTAFLDLSHDTLTRLRKRGQFPEPRVLPGGRLLRWSRDEVLGWFDGLERAAA